MIKLKEQGPVRTDAVKRSNAGDKEGTISFDRHSFFDVNGTGTPLVLYKYCLLYNKMLETSDENQ